MANRTVVVQFALVFAAILLYTWSLNHELHFTDTGPRIIHIHTQ